MHPSVGKSRPSPGIFHGSRAEPGLSNADHLTQQEQGGIQSTSSDKLAVFVENLETSVMHGNLKPGEGAGGTNNQSTSTDRQQRLMLAGPE